MKLNKGNIDLCQPGFEGGVRKVRVVHISDTHGKDYDPLLPGRLFSREKVCAHHLLIPSLALFH